MTHCLWWISSQSAEYKLGKWMHKSTHVVLFNTIQTFMHCFRNEDSSWLKYNLHYDAQISLCVCE